LAENKAHLSVFAALAPFGRLEGEAGEKKNLKR
jgi:hypothetical protein